ncbi:MAG: glycosyl transferase family 2 [Nitrospirales bacterium]|nr:MAG: glycosyl transferase family 2 [Nitrospirales bacterium]
MTIGVIIPTLNEEATLSSTLDSVSQARMDEVIIVDGGSQDRTCDIAEAYIKAHSSPRSQLLTASTGRACQMNAGGISAQSDIIMFLHADTHLPQEARQRIEDAMRSGKYVGGRFDVQFGTDRGYAWLISRMMNWRSRWSGIFTGDQAIFVRQTAFRQLNGFSDMPLMEDIEFSSRLKQLGPVISLRAKVTTSFRRWEHHGPLRTILHMWTLRLLYWLGISPHTLQQFYGTVR